MRTEYNAPNVLRRDNILMHWSSNLIRSPETEIDKFNVIVYSNAIPAKRPWKKVVILNNLF